MSDLIPQALPDREAPAAPREGHAVLPEAIPDRDFRHVAPDRARGTDPERQTHVTPQPGRLAVRVPGPAVIDERREPDAHQAPRLVRHEHAVLEREPHHPGAVELVDAPHAR